MINSVLSGRSPREGLSDPKNSVFAYEILQCASTVLFTYINAELGGERFEVFLREYLESHRGKSVPAESLFVAIRERFGKNLDDEITLLFDSKGRPACVVPEARYYELPGTDGLRYLVRFTAYNPRLVEGVFKAIITEKRVGLNLLIRDRREEQITRTFILPGGASKEIGIITDKPFYSWLGIETFLSENVPHDLSVPLASAEPEQGFQPFDGERLLPQPPVLNKPGEIVVDDTDPGFKVFPGTKPGLLMRLLKVSHSDSGLYNEISWMYNLPANWRPLAQSYFYGMVRKTACIIKAGKGERLVQWTADIPQDGSFEVFFYTQKHDFMLPMGKRLFADFHFRVIHDDEVEECKVELWKVEPGWVSLGTYRFSKGKASVELSDRTGGAAVFADAVKWVKK